MSDTSIVTTSKLNMTFGNEDGNKTISIDEPLDDLTSETVADNMAAIGALGTLIDSNGKVLTDAVGAEIETVTKQTLF